MAINPPREQLVLLNDELEGRSKLQSDELDGLDRKASTILAGTGVVLALTINHASDFGQSLNGVRFLFTYALLAFGVAAIAGVAGLWPRRIVVIPSPRGLVEGYYAKGTDDTLANLVSARLRSAEINKNISVGKLLAIRVQMVFFALGVVALAIAFLGKDIR